MFTSGSVASMSTGCLQYTVCNNQMLKAACLYFNYLQRFALPSESMRSLQKLPGHSMIIPWMSPKGTNRTFQIILHLFVDLTLLSQYYFLH